MDSKTTKEKILYSALDLISEKGYDGVGVDLIAEKAGIKGPSLYRHFKGKEDIFKSMIDMVDIHYTHGLELTGSKTNTPDSMNQLIEDAMEKIMFTMHDDVIRKTRRILAMEQFRSERMAELTTCYHYEYLINIYTDVFAAMIAQGIIKQDDPQCLALSFICPATILLHIYDRQPHREQEVLKKIKMHFEHFAKTYAAE